MNRKFLLMILDGWGIGDKSSCDVIWNANTKNYKSYLEKYPHSKLYTSGENVGLPEGQMGNSEVGHLNIGAGRVVYQDLVKINRAIRDGSIYQNEVLMEAYDYAKSSGRKMHFIGLVSHGGVHSMQRHLYKLCDIAKEKGIDDVFIHALTDGRDTDPNSGLGFVSELEEHLKTSAGKIATVTGRYYTMDRDRRWERIKIGYDAMVSGIGNKARNAIAAIQESYDNGITDEFIKPIIIVGENDKPIATIEEGDVVFCFNFRTDRLRQITIALTQKDMPECGMKTMNLQYYTMTRYDESFENVKVVFEKDNVEKTLGEWLSEHNKTQLRIAETEKYAHVTFFFSGGREEPFPGEKRALVPSPKVATYDLQPEMSAFKVKDALLDAINNDAPDFICLNFANGDMVGHTGVYESIRKAVEAVDECTGEIVEEAGRSGYDIMIIADHGNADCALNADNSPNTAHSLNPVPCIIIAEGVDHAEDGVLADVAPTILKIMGIDKPKEMTGKELV